MKLARTVLSTYSADAFGVCSALYELGGMVVMHDASGCNSTYSTHDEPRWYDSESLVFISALTEMEAIMGDDSKFLKDLKDAVETLHPKFVALAGTPIPMMIGCDLPTIAQQLEQQTGIPCFGFGTSGMHSYLCGVSDALAAMARRMTDLDAVMVPGTVNILGATPLDFSINGSISTMKALLESAGWHVLSTFAMGSTLEDIRRAGQAQVNLVISGAGMQAAQILRERFGTPYVVGTPTGSAFSQKILDCMAEAAKTRQSSMAFSDSAPAEKDVFLLGESVTARSLASALSLECGIRPRVVYPLERRPEFLGVLSSNDVCAAEEEELQALWKGAKTVIADPLYRPLVPDSCRFISLPHEAFSGRILRKDIPNFLARDIPSWFHQKERNEV